MWSVVTYAADVAPTRGVVKDEAGNLRCVDYAETHTGLIAWGGWSDTINVDGWSYLSIHTSPDEANLVQAKAAGYLEACLTHSMIYKYSLIHANDYGWSEELRAYYNENYEFYEQQIERAAGKDPFWEQVSLLLEQQAGMFEGYIAHAPAGHEISWEVMVTMSMHSDMDTLCPLYGGCTPVDGGAREKKEGNTHNNNKPPSAPFKIKDHCSVIVKLVPSSAETDSSNSETELYTSHTTWTGFQEMLRIYKMYDFPFQKTSSSSSSSSLSEVVPGRHIAMSSYPGNLFSTDDWYTISSGLVSTETTIDNHNESVWGEVQPRTVLTWIRTMVSNRLATDGASWAANFAKHNSGTYNNEFHVVDYNKFAASKQQQYDHDHGDGVGGAPLRLLPGVLTVIDQMPGHVEVSDETAKLQNTGYWASYNRPGLPYSYKAMNYTATVEAYGLHYSHELCARGQIFEMLHTTIIDEASLKKVMRWNKFDGSGTGSGSGSESNDTPLPTIPKEVTEQMCASGPSASNAISERGDLTKLSSNCADDVTRQNEGGIDMKYTTAALMAQAAAAAAAAAAAGSGSGSSLAPASIAQSGPTYDDQPVFVWSESPFPDVIHTGMPDRWEFPYVLVDWSSGNSTI
jgi:hypothetical protein